MRKNYFLKKILTIFVIALFFATIINTTNATNYSLSKDITTNNEEKKDISNTINQEILLPKPLKTDFILEETFSRRKSVRNFTEEPVSDEDLSTVLWSAYGIRSDTTMTVPSIGGKHGSIIYVLKDDAAYIYNPKNHSLEFYKDGDWRDIVGWQYKAPIQLCMCVDTDKIDRNLGGAEVGMIDQNIQLISNAIGLGTVVTAQSPPAIDPLGIPENQVGFTVIPLGHPDYNPYEFQNRPLWISFLPKIKMSDINLSTALEERKEIAEFGISISKNQISQMIWSTSGFSPYLDKSSDSIYHKGRHRTIPSGKGYYPIDIYVLDKNFIYKYEANLLSKINIVPVDFWGFPIITYLMPIKIGNFKQNIADACSESNIADASMIILFILDREKTRPEGAPDLSSDELLQTWYHDAGAGIQNLLLEATAYNINANFYEIDDKQAIINLLKLNEETTIPIFAAPIG